MVDRDMKEISDAIRRSGTETARALGRMSKIMDQARRDFAKLHHPSSAGRSLAIPIPLLDEPVPVSIDWESPTIKGTAELYRLENGTVNIIINVDPEDASRLQDLVYDGFVKGLSLSSVDPE